MRYLSILMLVVLSSSAMGAIYNVGNGGDLNAAVAAANSNPGADQIIIAAGTVITTAQVVIADDLTITGAGAGLTTIKPGVDTGSSGDARGWFLVQSGKQFSLSGVTLDGDSPTRLIHTAVRSWGVLDIEDCTIRNVRYTPVSYDGRGIGPYAGANTIRRVTFSNIGRIGVLTFGDASAVIDRCTYIGKGSGDWLDYAFEFGGGGTGSVTNCSITGCTGVASVDGSTSAGILATTYWGDGTSVQITGCTIFGCSCGILVGYDEDDTSAVTAYNNNLVGNETAVASNSSTVSIDASGNWWGKSSGPMPTGLGDWILGLVTESSPLSKPASDNVLYLVPADASIYVKPSESIAVDMNVANLQQQVKACQAILGFDSSLLGVSSVAAGGGAWDELIYATWTTSGAGKIDTAVGVYGDSTAGTDADGTVAKLVLTPKGEGVTQIVFRDDVDCGSSMVECTFLSDMSANPVFPSKVNSTNIYIDGTAPVITCPADKNVSTDAGVCYATVDVGTATATDALSGVESVVGVRSDSQPLNAAYPKGVTTITWTATDRAGNSSQCTQTITVSDTEKPTITAPSAVTVSTDPGVCYATNVDLGTPVTGDNCGVASVTNDAPSQFPKGTTTVTWTVTDTSGNTETATQTVTVNDNEAPTVQSATASPTCVKDQNVTISASGSDNCTAAGNLVWKHRVGAEGSWASGLTVLASELAEGSNTLYVQAVDEANNASEAFAVTTTVSKDTTAPTITSTSASPTCVKDQDVTITASATDEGCAGGTITWQHKVGSGSWKSGLVVANADLAEGENTLYVKATDGNGNSSEAEVSNKVSKDTTAPTITSTSASPTCVNDQDVTITASATDEGCAGGTITWQHRVNGGDPVSGLTVANSELSEGSNTLDVRAADGNGNVSDWFAVNSVSKDTTAPVISSVTATQGGSSVLCGEGVAIQGVVDIYVSASDAGCAGMTTPTVTVAGIGAAAYVDGTAPYHYRITVTSAAANGSHTVTVSAADGLGNSSSDSSKAICVDKNQITGQIELESFVGSSRSVTFVATGGTTKSWTVNLSFSGGVASYTLTQVPDGTTGLSAKTAWSLRNKISGISLVDGQAVVNFTGTEKLLGGDLNNTNSINILDYTLLKTSWFTSNPAADINGDGGVGTLDYSIMKANWFQVGDAE